MKPLKRLLLINNVESGGALNPFINKFIDMKPLKRLLLINNVSDINIKFDLDIIESIVLRL